ncbi:MAG: DNA polymerase III subunit delta [Ignavibacteriaceae bacterium]|nr:DNA polymerase III subunit delta [Ignavibacteriaceae bacterium]
MAKSKISAPSISEAVKNIKSGKLLPVYFFFGEDSFGIDDAVKALEEAVKPMIESEFDRETFRGDEKSITEVLDFASAFPFGSEKKFILVKDFDKIKDKKALASYAASPTEFTILALVNNGAVTAAASEPFKTLAKNNFMFEAKELKGNTLLNWLVNFTNEKGKNLTHDNARLLMDISGENRNLLEAQLDKIFTYLGDNAEISVDSIRALSTQLKEFTIFDLQNAIGKKNKQEALRIALSMLEKGAEPTYLVHMLTRYFTGLARVKELSNTNVPDQSAARIVGTHPFYYKDYLSARKIFTDDKIISAASALFKADMTIKTSSTDEKLLITVLITEILA